MPQKTKLLNSIKIVYNLKVKKRNDQFCTSHMILNSHMIWSKYKMKIQRKLINYLMHTLIVNFTKDLNNLNRSKQTVTQVPTVM
jgi:hypothetical protein